MYLVNKAISCEEIVPQTVKCLSTMRETQVQSLVWKDPLEKEMAIHSSTIAWKISWTEEPGRIQSMGSQRVGHSWATSLRFTEKRRDLWALIAGNNFSMNGQRMTLLCSRSTAAEPRWLRRTVQKRCREELPLAQLQGWQPRVPDCEGTGAAERSNHTPEVRCGGREELLCNTKCKFCTYSDAGELPKILFSFRDLIMNLPFLIIKIVKMIIRKFSERSTFTNCQQLFLLFWHETRKIIIRWIQMFNFKIL